MTLSPSGKWLLRAGYASSVSVGLAVAIGAVFCAATLHVPRSRGPRPDGASAVDILARDQIKLKAWWFPAGRGTNRGCVMVLHGIGDSRRGSAGFAPMFLESGYSVLTPDSRAHGESGGAFVTYGLLEKFDVIDWARWMKGQGCERVYGLGESLGASILIQAAAVEPVFHAIVAECPFADLQGMGEYRVEGMLTPLPVFVRHALAAIVVRTGVLYARWVEKLDFRQVSPMESLRVGPTPLLLIHGLADWRTPPSESRRLAAVQRPAPGLTNLWLVPGAGHTEASAVAGVEFWRRVLGWFER